MRLVTLVAVVVVLGLLPTAVATEHERFHSENLEQGDTFEVTFDQTGEYLYHCTPHPFMSGSISVEDDAESSGRVDVEIMDLEFVPAAITVAPGTTVVWTNRDSATTSGPRGHTVTEDVESPGPDETAPPADGDEDGRVPALGFIVAAGAACAALALRRR